MRAIRVCRADMTGLRGTMWPSFGRFEARARDDGRHGALYALVWLGFGQPARDYFIEGFDDGMRRNPRWRAHMHMRQIPQEPRWLVLDVELSEENLLGTAATNGHYATGWREISFIACEIISVTDLAGALAAAADASTEERLALASRYSPASLGFNATVGRSFYRSSSGATIAGD